MIPVRLSLENFLSYRDPVQLDLKGIGVACVCGGVGNGKSALFDAMTWALWGWARGQRYGQGGISAEALVYQSFSHMEVSLDFLVNDTTYRVIRKYSRGSRGRSSTTLLDLQVATGETTFRSLAEGSLLETERLIQRLLRIDYDTFINSAYLLQGESNRFSRSKPAERKAVLAEILGLSLYERLESRARALSRDSQTEGRLLQFEIERISETLEQQVEAETRLDAALHASEELKPRLEAAASALAETRSSVDSMQLQVEEVERLKRILFQDQESTKQFHNQQGALERRVEEARAVISTGATVEEHIEQLYHARSRNQDLEDLAESQQSLFRKKLEIQHKIDEQRSVLETRLSHLKTETLEGLNAKVEKLPEIRKAFLVNQDLTNDLGVREEQLELVRSELLLTSGHEQRLVAENAALRNEMQALRSRLDVLEEGVGTCPFCGTPVGVEGLQHIQAEVESEGKKRRIQFDTNKGTLEELITERERLEKTSKGLEESIRRSRSETASAQGALTAELGVCEAAEQELISVMGIVQGLEDELSSEQFAANERPMLEEVTKDIAALGYSPEEHKALRGRITALEPYIEQAGKLSAARESLPTDMDSLRSITLWIADIETRIAETKKSADAITQSLAALPALKDRLHALDLQHRSLSDDHVSIEAEISSRRYQLQELERLDLRKKELEQKVSGINDDHVVSQILVQAFGKSGVQALLIEAALPELEEMANQLLHRLSDGRLQLMIETQRATVKGEVRETLEIFISDALGTRSYDNFSGGEKFRIDFALRVGLSKLLASRAGAPLRTLFIDEGLGSQDAEGRQHVLAAIHEIQKDFDLILVITHVEEAKDAFPVRIEVNWTQETGSTFELTWA